MDPLITTACAAGLSQLLLGLLLLARFDRLGIREWLFLGLLVATACYLLPALAPGTTAAVLIAPWATAVPGLFWLFSSAVFDDHFRLGLGRWTPLGITVFLPMAGLLADRPPALEWLLFTLPQVLEFVLLGLSLLVVVQHWSTDLVESRRRLRVWFVGLIGIGLFALILAREVLFPGQAWLATWQYVPVAILLLGINLMLLDYRPGALFDAAGRGAEDPMTPADPALEAAPASGAGSSAAGAGQAVDRALVTRVQAYMEEENAWREMGLSIGQLAERLRVPQYRLRHAINVGLGYRNVSDFLNSYRIREAAGRLADPANGLPVLTIAMDAGFRSLSSFNRAFKEAHGITPTQYRKARNGQENLTDC